MGTEGNDVMQEHEPPSKAVAMVEQFESALACMQRDIGRFAEAVDYLVMHEDEAQQEAQISSRCIDSLVKLRSEFLLFQATMKRIGA